MRARAETKRVPGTKSVLGTGMNVKRVELKSFLREIREDDCVQGGDFLIVDNLDVVVRYFELCLCPGTVSALFVKRKLVK